MSIVHELGYWIRSGMVRRRGPRQGPRLGLEWLETRCVLSGDAILQWNAVALDALKNDYAIGQTPEQGGPTKDSRALAIVHAASEASAEAASSIIRSAFVLGDRHVVPGSAVVERIAGA